MSDAPLKILLVEDDPLDARLVERELSRAGLDFLARRVEAEADFLRELESAPDVILCDFHLPQFDSLRALELLQIQELDIPFIVVSGSIGEERAVELLRRGASDFILKDRMGRLSSAIHQALEQRRLKRVESTSWQRLRQKEEQYRELADSVPHLVWIMNSAGEYLYFNQQCVRYTGLDVAHLMTGGWKACLHSEDPREEKKGEPAQLRIRDAQGAYRWHLQRVISQRKGGGEVSWVGTCTDVHDQVRAVEALRNERDRFSLIASVAPGVIYTYRLSAQGVGTYAYLSPRAEELFGVAPEILLELSSDKACLVHPDDLEELERTRGQSASQLSPWHHEYRILHSSKGERWLEVHSNPIRDSDGATVWHGFIHDTTERRLLEAKFRQSQKMEAFGQLAGGVAHDFNNLLTVIKGYTQFSLEELSCDHPLWDNLNMVLEAGERAEALTAQLLAFSRQTLVKPQNLCINSAVEEVVKMLGRVIGEDISIELDLSESLPLIRTDPGHLSQLIMNLAVNARDAMPLGGRLRFATSQSQGWVQLAVGDTGCGMSAEVMARIFEPFYTTKEVGKGTGLGLATAYAIADTYGGRLEVESQPGQGSTFRLLLPGESLELSEPPPAQTSSQLNGSETILVVEDERALGQFLQRGLANHGYRPLLALSGEEALRRAAGHPGPIDLLLTDVVMPGTDGRHLAEQILLDRPQLKVLYVSGYTDDALLRRGVLEFRENFLSKPFSIQDICHKIREIFDAPVQSGASS